MPSNSISLSLLFSKKFPGIEQIPDPNHAQSDEMIHRSRTVEEHLAKVLETSV